ncbi:olfactory receptor 5F1-like [Xenopus tropicalis]|uniref:Olfactory receptor n=1 Tax=Xenopus tropicalis TaxID=8364 RepID=A0A8J0QNR2_XENTR|nr:olfactory receptor 5F1-like [Xenopus tropicalis]
MEKSMGDILGNQTVISELILLGVTDDRKAELFLFGLFLLIYIITLFGNSFIILSVIFISSLHSPMYFFLGNLAFSDLCYSTVVTPKMLRDIVSERKSITFVGCALQLYFFAVFASTECYMLSAMAYDRYLAICQPLLYAVIMNRKAIIHLAVGIYVSGFLTASIHTACTLTLSFCGPNTINHFYCDIPPLMELSCSDTYIHKTVIFVVVFCLGLLNVAIILASYFYIFYTIIHMQSSRGRHKAFSTCSSHLLCVSLFYGTVFFMYLRPASKYSVSQDKVVSVFYTMIIPMMNPIIYSLRNAEFYHAVSWYIKKLLLSNILEL